MCNPQNLLVAQRYRRTDRQTDGQTDRTTEHYSVHRAAKQTTKSLRLIQIFPRRRHNVMS